jgi:hypothetical protein
MQRMVRGLSALLDAALSARDVTMNTVGRRVLPQNIVIAAVLFLAVGVCTESSADTLAPDSSGTAAPLERIVSTNGSFARVVPIEVPEFRGLERRTFM